MHTYIRVSVCVHRISARRRIVPLGPQLTLVVGQHKLGGVGVGGGGVAKEMVVGKTVTAMTVTGVLVVVVVVVAAR